ncbi:uncharacterized protein KY384_004646 [Bacidia gigantensis]|uniref:uncharacterized protein n=1 Tax=Bacidia gigantensis TaxID=2732470 RepID=UPI001D04DDDE|nr:uncharacterized protein KY384_004646 [Bacidia gigantensis]KAG8530608.1 hypothetical protein KY384_004646 [Bacidia gigantensis]
MASKSRYAFPLHPRDYASTPTPNLEEWQQLWQAWDLVTTEMIPRHSLMEQPIPLRNPLLFYLGHIPTFEDIHISRALRGKHTEPSVYVEYFERGIDPDVDDPEVCHQHSQLPKSWPTVDEILDFRRRVCRRIATLYDDENVWADRTLGRALWIGFEHEALHLETFLYMTLLSPNIKPPPVPMPDFHALAEKSKGERKPNQWFRIPKTKVTHGWSNSETDEDPSRFFVWDNERPPYQVDVGAFEAQARPISNGEYARYLVETGKTVPVTWTSHATPGLPDLRNGAVQHDTAQNGISAAGDRYISANQITCVQPAACQPATAQANSIKPSLESFLDNTCVRTVFGQIPLRSAEDWPLVASFNECKAYADWAGGRIPSYDEIRSIYHQVELQKPFLRKRSNGADHMEPLHPDPEEMFVDLSGCNVGLQNFHPVSVTQNGDRLAGLGDMGGAWEWTSTLLLPFEGFKAMDIYPGYTGTGSPSFLVTIAVFGSI